MIKDKLNHDEVVGFMLDLQRIAYYWQMQEDRSPEEAVVRALIEESELWDSECNTTPPEFYVAAAKFLKSYL